MAESLHVSVVTPAREVLEERTSHVSVPAHDGLVGLLPGHSPLLIKLGYGQMTLGRGGEQLRTYFIGGGFAQMKADELTVLTDEATPLSELDAAQAQRDLDEALQGSAETEAQRTRRSANADRARAMLRLSK